MENIKHIHADAIRRAAPPAVMDSQDIATLLRVRPDAVQQVIKSGALGPYFKRGRRYFIVRDQMIEHLRAVALATTKEREAAEEADRRRRQPKNAGRFGVPTGKVRPKGGA